MRKAELRTRGRRRGRRRGSWLVLLLLLALASPLLWLVAHGVRHDRDLLSAWRAWRAPGPEPIAEEAALPAAPFGPAVHVGILLDPALVEVSGLAGSRARTDLLWAVNDGGNEHRLHALSTTGELLRSFDVAVPEARFSGDTDWEDLASFQVDGEPHLLIADVGDNYSWRRHVVLWVVAEPALDAPAVPLGPRARIELRYADGPRDCEAVAVDEESQTVLLVSKRTAPPVVYAAPLGPLLAGGGEVVAEPLVALEGIPLPTTRWADAILPAMLHMPTALELAPDGSAAIVLGYAAGWRFPRAPGEPWAAALARTPERIALPPLALAEAAAYAGGSLFVTSELDRLALVRWRAPLVRFDPLPPPEPEPAPVEPSATETSPD